MDVCRICLSISPDKDISQLEANEDGLYHNHIDVFMFCLDIMVTDDPKMSSKLCSLCFKKILSYYKFKSLALKSDAYLRAVLVSDSKMTNEIFLRDDLKDEMISINSNDLYDALTRENVKEEISADDHIIDSERSVDEYKQFKSEEIVEETKENAPFKRKREKVKKIKFEGTPLQVCEECGKTVRNLKLHLYHHKPLAKRMRVECKECGKTFASHSARYKHNQIKHLGIKYKCEICGKYVVNMKQHNLVVHNSDALRFECVSCGRRFISQYALDAHVVVHTKDRPYQCSQCDKKFRTKIVMRQHIRQVHEKEKTHLCQFCSKSFFKKFHLQVHLRSHTKEKPYECPDCGKFYSSGTVLRSHRLTHNAVKMFACSHCDMTFTKVGYLRAHLISHTKEKRYGCKYCDTKFGRSDHRKRHEQNVHERHMVTFKTNDVDDG